VDAQAERHVSAAECHVAVRGEAEGEGRGFRSPSGSNEKNAENYAKGRKCFHSTSIFCINSSGLYAENDLFLHILLKFLYRKRPHFRFIPTA
jgi:hypothetical protein